ncbi:MAG TPA: serine hydrolase [Candidatus Saccharimonadia bacterium]
MSQAPASFDQRAARLTEAAIQVRLFPGTVVGYYARGRSTVLPFGRFTYDAASPVVQPGTIYDVASITKSVPTSCLILQLVDSGKLALDTPAIAYVPELTTAYRERITVRHLLTYTVIFNQPQGLSGLAQLYGKDFLEPALQSELTDPPGQRYFYTNPPALILGLIAERVTGRPLGALAEAAFFGPLGMGRTSFFPERLPLADITPTEVVNGQEVRGVVQDETARVMASMGRQSGNAGLFSDVAGLLRFGQMVAARGEWDGRRYLQPKTVIEMARNQLTAIGEHSGLGWEINRPEVMGRAARDQVLIKSGHTGCLLVIDLEHQAVLVMLSNRTYPKRGDRAPLREYWCRMNEAFWDDIREG